MSCLWISQIAATGRAAKEIAPGYLPPSLRDFGPLAPYLDRLRCDARFKHKYSTATPGCSRSSGLLTLTTNTQSCAPASPRTSLSSSAMLRPTNATDGLGPPHMGPVDLPLNQLGSIGSQGRNSGSRRPSVYPSRTCLPLTQLTTTPYQRCVIGLHITLQRAPPVGRSAPGMVAGKALFLRGHRSPPLFTKQKLLLLNALFPGQRIWLTARPLAGAYG